ncbi:MAG: hypothetical protein HRT58_01345 [Crocinitomicaceae bacterium]|nr:hypothetical protein [Flavobacteriales bacterium]NQZ34268.1 hypothetical protein [Crocinitomicaceae bacterium]PHR36688.1 MAG: hypothetical protein COA38_01290 [Fluviicola sp.]
MNRSLLLLVSILVSGLFAFNSCEKKVISLDPELPDLIPEKLFEAFIDGVQFIDTILWGAESTANSTLTITATADGAYPKIILILPSDIVPGNYTFGGTQSTSRAILKFGPLPADQFEADSGKLWITRHNTDVDFTRGSFEFLAKASAGNTSTLEFDVTDGQFIVSY